MNDGEKSTAYEGWAIVDLFGHVKLAGQVREAQQYGTTMLRIDVPSVDGSAAFTKFVGGSAIYSLVPTTQEIAEGVIRRARPVPVNPFEIQLAPRLGEVKEGEEAAPACRRCSECLGEDHHWLDNPEARGEGDSEYACKHCDATAFMCAGCEVAVRSQGDLCPGCLTSPSDEAEVGIDNDDRDRS